MSNSTSVTCQSCDMILESREAYRIHAKTPSHVDKLRSRVATSSGASESAPVPTTKEPYDETDSDTESSESSGMAEEDSGDDDVAHDFVPDQCLFCAERQETVDENIQHMRKLHNLVIPYQSYLTVDVGTLIWFLHLVVYGYHECISCGTRRRTREAIQHHMVAKGHYTPNLSSEVAEFYNDLPSDQPESSDWSRPDETSLRLASGKILGHRSQTPSSHRPRPARQSSQEPQLLTGDSVPHEDAESSKALERADRRAQVTSMEVARLGASDQRALAHLSASEQRSVLAVRKKQLDKARREELRWKTKMERAGNKTLMKHFKPDVPGRKNG